MSLSCSCLVLLGETFGPRLIVSVAVRSRVGFMRRGIGSGRKRRRRRLRRLDGQCWAAIDLT